MGFLIAVLGALMNRVRGGWLLKKYHDLTNTVVFGILCGAVYGGLEPALMGMLGMALGASLGWGRYIGALGGWETKPLQEVDPIDWMIRGWRPEKKDGYYRPSWKLRLWGASGLALRGSLWAAALTLPTLYACVAYSHHIPTHNLFLYMVWAGVMMPLSYMVALSTAYVFIFDWKGKGWEIGEVLFGAALWGGWAYFLRIG